MNLFLIIVIFIIMIRLRLIQYGYFKANFQNKSHYEILGLKKGASEADIKKKYYQLAKMYHPDVNQQPEAKSMFQNISTAYKILSDKNTKHEYDRNTTQQPEQKFYKKGQKKSQGSRFEQENPESFTQYDQYFKKNKKYKKPRRGTDINVNIGVTLKEAINGVKKSTTFTREQICEKCSEDEFEMCFTCGGKGQIYNRSRRQKEECARCSSKGYINNCSECRGKSTKIMTRTQEILIKKNTNNKTILRVQGHGNHGFRSKNGDLYATIIIQDSYQYKIDGNNIHSEHQVDYLTAIFGGTTKVQTVYGNKQIEIEPGIQTGSEIRIMNQGMQSSFSRRRGDHIVTIRIKIPQKLTLQQKDLFSKLL